MMSMKRMISLYLIAVACAILIHGCSTCDPVASLYVEGIDTVSVNAEGVLEQAKKVTAKYSLKAPGESFIVEQGRTFELSVPNPIDLSSHALVVSKIDTVVPGGQYYRVALRESCAPYIEMSEKCQVVNWYNPYRLPEVRMRNTSHQLVTTPLLGKTNEVIGYEVRLGTIEDDCQSVALKRFSEVRESLKKQNKKETVIFKAIRSTPRKSPAQLAELIVVRPPS
jgi:hypothetical protein